MARYRLTESQLRNMIGEAVKSVLMEQQPSIEREYGGNCFSVTSNGQRYSYYPNNQINPWPGGAPDVHDFLGIPNAYYSRLGIDPVHFRKTMYATNNPQTQQQTQLPSEQDLLNAINNRDMGTVERWIKQGGERKMTSYLQRLAASLYNNGNISYNEYDWSMAAIGNGFAYSKDSYISPR